MYVYVISAGAERHKIGVALDPEKRCGDLQCGSHDELRVVFAEHVGPRAIEIEHAAHGLLRDRRIRREWFQVTGEVATDAIRRALAGERAPKPNPLRRNSWSAAHPPLSVRLPRGLKEEIEAWAAEAGLTRHAAMLQLIDTALAAEGIA